MKRRDFLKTTGIATSASIMLGGVRIGNSSPLFEQFASLAQNEDRKLIVIFLNGGNDGLNTLVPIDQYANLYNARENVLIPQDLVLKLNDKTGLHPSLSGLKNLYDEGKLHVLQSVGYPQPNFSHFRSTDIWTSGSDSDKLVSSGWLGRYLYNKHPEYPQGYPNNDTPDPLSITYGPYVSPTCQGPAVGMGMAITPNREGEIDIYDINSGGSDTVPDTPAGDEIEYIKAVIDQTQVYGGALEETFEKGKNLQSNKWPENNNLANQLRVTAQLIAGGSKTKIFVHSLGGFDTHANQVERAGEVEGFHSQLLTMVSESVEAFQDEMRLQDQEKNVVGMTFSEFGRRILSNASNGTDHGTAAPLFVFGTNVIPTIQGTNPEIPKNVTVQDNLPMQFDFRSVYYSILQDWFEVKEEDLDDVMLKKFQHLDIISKPTSVNNSSLNGVNSAKVFPNPIHSQATIQFTSERGYTKVSLFNARGQEVRTIIDRYTLPMEQEINFNTSGLPTGNYHIRIQTGNRQETKAVSVVR